MPSKVKLLRNRIVQFYEKNIKIQKISLFDGSILLSMEKELIMQ